MRQMLRAIATVVVISGAAISSAPAQAAHPNYAGNWVMDASKSQGSGSIPTAATWTIVQRGDTLISDREATIEGVGAVKSHMVVGFDGRPWKNTVPQPGIGDVEVTVVASWDKGALVLATTGTIQETEFVQTVRWVLSTDGKSLTLVSSVTVAGAEVQSATTVWARKS